MPGFDPLHAAGPAVMVDSSVWVGWLRGETSRQIARLPELARLNAVLVGDLILAELLQGARDDPHAEKIMSILAPFQQVGLVGPEIAVAAARNDRTLRGRGITIRKTIDLLIGTWCIAHGVPLLHDDRDFEPMRQHLGLPVA